MKIKTAQLKKLLFLNYYKIIFHYNSNKKDYQENKQKTSNIYISKNNKKRKLLKSITKILITEKILKKTKNNYPKSRLFEKRKVSEKLKRRREKSYNKLNITISPIK